ncbi:3-oxoacyl-[acyl-carrier protein] reductase [Acidisarcina polymorpha]|uniref:3-oxoacyl-[acyl-carrier protein] reductase n=1 Tax=Acidisarcina polymorpha TaxID=2211140 RepID=A0A2Z5G2E9_9BACT|nr:SDR family NAD(P)-dependent oxidoreductase [Acidisarcina polymorpha]AXC13268.1 3-oxoacyl-[acyl-carrier protein] reductase [Acidisarcina polymorpha]
MPVYLSGEEFTPYSNKVALITESNRGIGFETARQLGRQGVAVIVTERTSKKAADTALKLQEEGIQAPGVTLYIT